MSNDNFKKMTDVYQVLFKQHEPQSLALSYQPITYEKSIFKQMADDVKSPFEAQLETLQSIADSAEKQAEASKEQAELAKKAAERAEEEAKSAKREALFSKIVAVISIVLSIVAIVVQAIT